MGKVIFEIMMPSIYQEPKTTILKHHKRARLKISSLICALCFGMAALISLITCYKFGWLSTGLNSGAKDEIITFVRRSHHPKNVRPLDNEDVFISVKTTWKNHQTRLTTVINTWYTLARENTYFFTDAEDPSMEGKIQNGHLIVTQCGSSHSRQDLCCKMGAEFDAFLDSDKKWFCHFDDDNYVNVPRLVEKLNQFDHRHDWYLGKPALPEPLEIPGDRKAPNNVRFWFATGGAGFCLSQSLALKMMPIIGGGKFETIGEKIRLPDDVAMGYVAEHLLQVPLTVIEDFHSHMEPHKMLPTDDKLKEAISYSYFSKEGITNVLDLEGGFSIEEDPTRFKSLHCALFPNFSWCPAQNTI